MIRKALILSLLLGLTGCTSQWRSGPVTKQRENPNVAAAQGTYKLQISFFGLIAFAQDPDTKNFWAFLVKAQPNLQDQDEASFPPGVLQEINNHTSDAVDFPAHFAQIRFNDNVKIVSSTIVIPNQRIGISIAERDLRFATKVAGPPSGSLSGMSNAEPAIVARQSADDRKPKLRALDVLGTGLTGSTLDPRLSARALIESGKVEALPYTGCGAIKYSFHLPEDSRGTCPEPPGGRVTLSEEVRVTQNVAKDVDTEIILAPYQKIVIRPIDDTKPVIVEVVDQIKEAILDPDDPFCDMVHYPAYRWYYRLLADTSDTANHFFPCPIQNNSGGAKCPNKSFIIQK